MAGILQFSLGLNTAQFSGAAKQAESFLESLAHKAKGSGGAFGEMAEKMATTFKSLRGAGTSFGAGGFLNLAGAIGSGLVAAQAIKGVFVEIGHLAAEAAEKFIEAAEHGAQLFYKSNRTSTGIGALYGIEEGSKMVGLAEEAPTQMMVRLQRALSGVSETGERTDNTFRALGLSMAELRKLAPDKQFLEVLEALHEANSGTRAGFASNLFGRGSYGDVLQIVNQLETFKEAMKESDAGGGLFAGVSQAFALARGEWGMLKADIEVGFAAVAKYLTEPFRSVVEMLKSIPWQSIGEGIGMALKPLAELVRIFAEMAAFGMNPQKYINKKTGEVGAAWEDAHSQSADKQGEAMWHNFAGLAGKWFLGMPFTSYGQTQTGQGNENAMTPAPYMAPHNNPFEKMGFVFNGGRDEALDYAKRTALATEKIAEHVDRDRHEGRPTSYFMRNEA